MSSSNSSRNFWPNSRCAKAFWGQYRMRPYKGLLADTKQQMDPQAGDRWLDLGCGRGMLTQAIWEQSGGRVAEIVGVDVADVNSKLYDEFQTSLSPRPRPGQVRFVAGDFDCLKDFPAASFDGAVAGLAISYAESYSEELGCWTTEAYDRVLANVSRVLKPGGRFVFSVNVPEPSWFRVALSTTVGVFQTWRPVHLVVKALQICTYGAWLKQEARRGRFHYLPISIVREKLLKSGLGDVSFQLSFSNQAYLISAYKPVATKMSKAA